MADIRKRDGSKGTTYQVRYPDPTAKSGYSYATFDTLKEARAFREDSRARVAAPKARDVRTVEEAVSKWLDVCEKEGRDGRDPVTAYTLKGYRHRAEIIKSYPWDKSLHELAAPDVIEFRSWLLQSRSRDQARKVLSSFHSLVLEMVNRGVLAHDIASGVGIRGGSRYDEPVSIPSEQEVKDLLAAADRLANSSNRQTQRTWERYRPMLYLAADTGMRPQEYLVAARSKLKDGTIEVDRALDGGGQEISVTKSPSGRRVIDLSPQTYDMLLHYARKKRLKNPYDLLFPTSTGRWQSIKHWRNRGFAAACEEAGLMETVDDEGEIIVRPKYRPYDLRHFYASMLIEQRVNLKMIQYLMGHRDIQTTLSVYGHLIERVELRSERNTGLIARLS
ncbi:site-specific recombinase XerD [Rhizobium azibense]|uniref:Site-specific recombinase XerD n=1 Tax=Rhizobium azibense TaxID=1136135 RepID=A0A4V6P0Z2_9HYPH|nr:site-specific integrase [Rhizobium azibense]TCU21835.1 site-specific recombinase XerD [Rhizobium azibense]